MEEMVCLAAGVWNISMALLMKTENFLSGVVFNVFPFFLGVGQLLVAARFSGLI